MWSTVAPQQHTVADCTRLQNVGLRTARKHHQLNRSRSRCRVGSEKADIASRRAAQHAIDNFVKDGQLVGLGHGSMVIYALEHLAKRVQQGVLKDVSCLAASDVASVEAAVHGIPLRPMQDTVQADITVVEADELDCTGQALSLITGRAHAGGHPQLPRLRELLTKSKRSLVLAPNRETVVNRLGGALPVVIEAGNWETTAEELDDLFLGDAEVWRRPREGTANPRGGSIPYVSEEGHNILDIRFLSSLRLFGEAADYSKLAEVIEAVKGVVTHGLLLNIADVAVIAQGTEPRIVEKGLLFGFSDG